MKVFWAIARIFLALGAVAALGGMLLVALDTSGVIGDPMVWQR